MGSMKSSSGYSLVELMVTIAIFTIISTTVLLNNQQFNGGIILTNMAYDLATSIREAQVYGLSSKGVSGNFKNVYGLHVTGVDNQTLLLFYDSGDGSGGLPNGGYSTGEEIQTTKLTRGIKIKQFCVTSGGSDYCSVGGVITELDITFKRPNPDAKFRVVNPGAPISPITGAKIDIWSPETGRTKQIKVESTGQISVKTP